MFLRGILYYLNTDAGPGDIEEAVVTDEGISLDWVEDGDRYHAVLRCEQVDGYVYEGNYGNNRLNEKYRITAHCYKSVAGDYVLWCSLFDDEAGYEYEAVVHLTS